MNGPLRDHRAKERKNTDSSELAPVQPQIVVPTFSNPAESGFQFSDIPVFPSEVKSEQPDSEISRIRGRVEHQTGYDLSSVRVHQDSPILGGSSFQGLTLGHDVHLQAGWNSSGQGGHVLAHEFAHTVQQSTGAANQETTSSTQGYDSLEHQAEVVAERSETQGLGSGLEKPALSPMSEPAQPVAQGFDPRFHRKSIVNALSDPMGPNMMAPGFTPEEIGAIYAANWERDFSQAHPSLGNVVLAWKQVKLAAADNERTPQSVSVAETGFNQAIQNVLESVEHDGVDKFMLARSYGGYAFWEHMDNPGADINKALNDRLKQEMDREIDPKVKLQMATDLKSLPAHVYIAREHIKEMLYDAVSTAHPDFQIGGSALNAHNRSLSRTGKPNPKEPEPVLRSQGLNSPDDHNADPSKHTTVNDQGQSTAPIKSEVSSEVRDRTLVPAGSGLRFNPVAYEKLGRASHALEDFWSHSNFVEIAIGEAKWDKELAKSGRDSNAAGEATLTTGTFGDTDSSHAVAHKIRAAADEIQTERQLLDHALGRGAKLPDQKDVKVGDESEPTPESDQDEQGLYGNAFKALGEESAWDEFIRNPATAGAAAGGYAGHDAVASATLGAVAGVATGTVGGAAGGWKAGHDLLGKGLAGDIGGGVLGVLGGAVGAVTGIVSGTVGGMMGGASTAATHPEGGKDGALQGAGVFGKDNLKHVATSLALSSQGVSLLRSVAEKLEEKTREKQVKTGAYDSHTMLAKDQPGHDRDDRVTHNEEERQDHLRDLVKGKKFKLAMELSTAADQNIIAQANKALTATTAEEAQSALEGINAKLDQLIAPPTTGHPLWGIVEKHRKEIETSLNNLHGKSTGS
jgi:Domain of unknown function (DUF4157)/Heterokaryon incompatibility protein Het-C